MRDRNYIAEALNKNNDFIAEMDKATTKMFNDVGCEELFKNKKREIKAYRDDENAVIYLFDKKDNKIEVLIEEIHSFNKKGSIKEIIHWDIIARGNKVEELHKPKVIVCDYDRKAMNKEITEEVFEEQMLNGKSEEESKTLMSFISNIKKVFGEKYLNNSEFLNAFLKSGVECTSDVGTIQQYCQLLSDKGYMKNIDKEFFKGLTVEAFKDYQPKLADWIIGMNSMLKSCEENKFTSYKKAYEFNDLDNHVWTKNGKLVVSSQNLGFYFHIQDDNNFKIYTLFKEYESEDKEISRIEKAISSGTINELKDVFMEVKDGQITALNDAYMYCFELDMKYSVKAMKEDGVLKVEYPVDITSYEYQRDYYHHRFGLNEFEFIAQAMMTLGGGFEYDKEKGIFVDDSITYIPNLPKAPNTRDVKIEKFTYLSPKSISYLNKDWLDATKFAVEVLKRDNPKPIVYYNADNEQDAINKAIKYYELKIGKLENNNKPKI